ncbi:MAG: hypothetical protein NC095_04455 [Muribaculum sp.]|nr:hypothetical protein [Muribaculum sp.]
MKQFGFLETGQNASNTNRAEDLTLTQNGCACELKLRVLLKTAGKGADLQSVWGNVYS